MQSIFQYLVQHLDILIGWLVTLSAALITALIPLMRHGRRYHERKAEKEVQARRLHMEHLLLKYAQEVLPNSELAKIQILHMAHPHKLEELYVQLRVQPGAASQSLLDARLRQAEEMHDPDLYLQAELDLLEHYTSGAIDPVEALHTYTRMVVVGDPGSGKTTLLRYLALQAAKQELKDLPRLPLYVELSRFDERKHRDLLDLIIARLSDFIAFTDEASMKELIDRKMSAGQVLLLLDGLDEMRLGADQDEARHIYSLLVREIQRIASLYTSMPVLVTVRKAHYQHAPKLVEGFHEVEIASFRSEDSQTFVKQWFQTSLTTNRAEKMRGLQAQIEESMRVRSLVSNPLLLTLAAIVYEKYLELPESRAEFYRLCVKECIEVLQGEWDARRDIRRPGLLSSRAQLHLLQEIAWQFHTRGMHLFSLEELLQVIESFLPKVEEGSERAKAALKQITNENGLLREQASGVYGFSHLTFQEYFVAQYLNVHRNEMDLLKYLHNPWWEQVALFYATMHDESWLLSILLGHEPQHFVPDTIFYTHLLLAGRCLAEKQPLIRQVSLREEVVNRLFDLLLTSPYALLREQAATTLAMISGQRINSHLLNVLEEREPALQVVRECIGEALGSSGEKQLALELAELLLRETERSMRLVLIRALGLLRNPEAVPILLRMLQQKEEDPYIQQRIALTMVEFQSDEVIGTLLHLLELPAVNPMVQRGAIIALGMLGDRPMIQRLLHILRDERRDPLVRTAVAKALGKQGQAEWIADMKFVLENQEDTIYVRQRIAASIGVLRPTEQVISYLLPLLERSGLNLEVKCSIAEALGMSGNKQVVYPLVDLLEKKHLDVSVGASIVLTLGYLGDDSRPVLDALHRLLRVWEARPGLYATVLAALGMLGVRAMKSELLQALRDANLERDLLLHVLHALGCLSHHHAIDKQDIARQLVLLLKEEQIDRYIKENIASLLKNIGETTILDELFDLLEHQAIDRVIRQQLIEFVGQIADSEIEVERIKQLLRATDIGEDIFRSYWSVYRRVHGKV